MDGLLAYMYTMIQECAAQGIQLNRAFLNRCGQSIQLFPGVFAAIFTSNAELLTFTKPMLRIYTLALGLFGIQIACQMTFTSLGNAKASIIVAVMRKFILLLPLIYIMPHLYTADLTKAVFMAEPVADVLAVAFTGVLFFFEFRKALRAMPKSEKRS